MTAPKPVAVFLDRHRPEVRAAIAAECPPEALAEALKAGRLAGVGIDVFGVEPPPATHPLLRVASPGLVLTPHLAGSAFDNVAAVARHVFANIRRVLRGEPLPPGDLVSP